MIFCVSIAGVILYQGESWPMARAALDHVMLDGNCFPVLMTFKKVDLES